MRYFVRVDVTVMRFRLEFAISYEIHSLNLEKYFFMVLRYLLCHDKQKS
jgi:hypothetical protein